MAQLALLATVFCELKRLDCNNMQLPVINVISMHTTSKLIVDITCTSLLFPKSLKCAFIFAFLPGAVFLVPKATAGIELNRFYPISRTYPHCLPHNNRAMGMMGH